MKLESGTFANCYNLNNVVIPNSITSISSSVFYECSKLSNITLSENLRVIGGRAFDGCGMSSITIPASVVKIGCAAFENCTKLSSIYISDLTSWCNINFDCLDSFKRINYYTNPLYLAHHLYLNGEEITELTIPSNISKINDCAFIGGYGFDSVIFPETVKSIGKYAFSECKKISNIELPSKLEIIDNGCFQGCSQIKRIEIPNSVKSIGTNAFEHCSSLKDLVIGSGIETIMNYSFSNCQDLANVYCYSSSVPQTYSYSFRDSFIEYATLHVPMTSVSMYQSAEPWKSFKEIVALTDSDPKPSGIKTINNTLNAPNMFFNLSGRKIEQLQKGVYITKGKKVIVK